jgi:hypothetical protein
MGWWDAPEGLLGDGPVDLIEDVMAEWTEAGRPTWQELLNGISTALADRGRDWLGNPESHARPRVRAEFTPARELFGQPDAIRDRYHDMWTQAFEQVAEEYEETQGRKPTLSELLGTIAFSLRVRPERFLRTDGNWNLITIDAAGRERA